MSYRTVCAFAIACACLSASADPAAPPQAQVIRAVASLDRMAAELMQRSGVPGMAIAVVQGDRILYAKGFGVRAVGSPQKVDADTVFALASVSKPLGATVVAQQVGAGVVAWDTPVRKHLPWFTPGNPYVSDNVTIGDLYAHRSGLPDHAGDSLEEMGYSQEHILRRLNQLPLTAFRSSYAYANYGMTAAAEAVATASGSDWASLSERVLYRPLGMASTSGRFADFLARPNRAPGHVKENGRFVLGPERSGAGEQRWSSAVNTDRTQATGGTSSSARDMARWMSFVLSGGKGPDGAVIVPAAALMPALTPKSITYEAKERGKSAGHNGYGFSLDTTDAGRTLWSHSGALSWGASTNVSMLPSANTGIVVLTNTWPTGVPEALAAQFNDIVQTGRVQKDWYQLYASMFAPFFKPQGELAGKARSATAAPAKALESYVGNYQNDYHGTASVVRTAQGGLELRLGPAPHLVYALQHWDGDTFSFMPVNDTAPPGSISKAQFSGNTLTLEHYNHFGLGTFARTAP